MNREDRKISIDWVNDMSAEAFSEWEKGAIYGAGLSTKERDAFLVKLGKKGREFQKKLIVNAARAALRIAA